MRHTMLRFEVHLVPNARETFALTGRRAHDGRYRCEGHILGYLQANDQQSSNLSGFEETYECDVGIICGTICVIRPFARFH